MEYESTRGSREAADIFCEHAVVASRCLRLCGEAGPGRTGTG